jgi:hypothetical protein
MNKSVPDVSIVKGKKFHEYSWGHPYINTDKYERGGDMTHPYGAAAFIK